MYILGLEFGVIGQIMTTQRHCMLHAIICYLLLYMQVNNVYTRFSVWCHWWFHYPGLLLHTELMVSLFIRCTMRCEIWAQPAELPR